MDAGVLTYAYGKPVRRRRTRTRSAPPMIALPAAPLTYQGAGAVAGKMSDEQVEQIMNARPVRPEEPPAPIAPHP